MKPPILRITVLVFACTSRLLGQTSSELRSGDRSVGLWAGVSPSAHLRDLDLSNRQVFLIGLRAEWVIETFGRVAVSTTADLLPIAVVTRTPTYRVRQVVTPGGGTFTVKETTGSKAVYGAGTSPFGFRVSLAPSHSVRIFANSAVGGLWFTREMPLPDTRKFNLSFEYGGGVEFANGVGRALVLGTKFHHMSNANTGAFNPGLEGNMFYLGLSRRR